MSKTMPNIISIPDYFADGTPVNAIELPEISDDLRKYHPSSFDGWQYVFTKDNLASYHMMYDNCLHWIWNEYNNDPARFDSIQYWTQIMNRVFTTINARILGVINSDDNHAEIMELLQRFVPDVNMMDFVSIRREKLRGGRDPFNKDDAVVWYDIIPNNDIVEGYNPKPLVVPYINLNDRRISLRSAITEFYTKTLSYAITYYAHMYFTKFISYFVPVTMVENIFAFESHYNYGSEFIDIHSADNIDAIISEKYLTTFGSFDVKPGEVKVLAIASENGQFYDKNMNTFTYAYLINLHGEYMISSMRGYDSFVFRNNSFVSRRWFNTMSSKGKNTEAILSDVWRDVMQCNAVLFPVGHKPMNMQLRVTHYSNYEAAIDKVKNIYSLIVDEDHDIAYVEIISIMDLVQLWEIFNHTLDLWVKYDNGRLDWSLISNIYRYNISFYKDNPHITKTPYDKFDIEDGDIIAVIPRNGMTYAVDNNSYTITNMPINGMEVLKCYL